MFQDDLFHILKEEVDDHHAQFSIHLNREHSIYSGHFPGDPITPGVCVVQIAVDLFSHLLQKECELTNAKNIKFLNIIKPTEHDTINYELNWEKTENESYKVKVVVKAEDVVFSKMSLELSEERRAISDKR